MIVEIYDARTREVVKSYTFKSYKEGVKAACRLQRDVQRNHFYVMGQCPSDIPGMPKLGAVERVKL